MNRLREILKCLDLSQAEFAKRTGLSEGAISHYISGDREPTLTSIQAILRVLPCSYETIWGKPSVNATDFPQQDYIQMQKRRHMT